MGSEMCIRDRHYTTLHYTTLHYTTLHYSSVGDRGSRGKRTRPQTGLLLEIQDITPLHHYSIFTIYTTTPHFTIYTITLFSPFTHSTPFIPHFTICLIFTIYTISTISVWTGPYSSVCRYEYWLPVGGEEGWARYSSIAWPIIYGDCIAV